MTLRLEMPTEELALRVPEDAERRERLAVALYDARMVSQGGAARIAVLTRADFSTRSGVTASRPSNMTTPRICWLTPRVLTCDGLAARLCASE
jgi:hypothetical protein